MSPNQAKLISKCAPIKALQKVVEKWPKLIPKSVQNWPNLSLPKVSKMLGFPIVKNLILWRHQVKVALAIVKLNPRQDWERERERSSLQKLTTLTLTWRRPSGCPSCMQRRRKRKKRNGSQPCRWRTHRPKWQRKRGEEKICSKIWTFAGPGKISSQLKLCFWILPIIVTVQRMIRKSEAKPLCATTATFTR